MQISALTDFKFVLRVESEGSLPTYEGLGAYNLQKLLNQYGLLVFDPLKLDPILFENFARQFGTLEITRPPTHRLPGHYHIRLQSTIPGEGVKGGGTYWHADSPWYEPAAVATLLYCKIAPASDGETLFVDMRAVLQGLPQELRQMIESLKGWYPCQDVIQQELKAMSIADTELEQQMENIRRSLLRIHPITGEVALYLNEKWLQFIEGLSSENSKALLEELYRTVSSSPYLYHHKWKEGQLLIWDNCIVAHKAYPMPEECHKVTLRIVVKQFHPTHVSSVL